MRFAPLLLPHLQSLSSQLSAAVTLASLITHGYVTALSSVVAFARWLREIFCRPAGEAPSPEWWLDERKRICANRSQFRDRASVFFAKYRSNPVLIQRISWNPVGVYRYLGANGVASRCVMPAH